MVPTTAPAPPPVEQRSIWLLCKQSITSWLDDRGQTLGASLAFYTVFSLAPLLLIVISVAGLLIGAAEARSHVVTQLQSLVGQEGAAAIRSLLESTSQSKKSVVAAIVGVVTLLVGATSVFAELQDTLDHIWRAPVREKVSGVWAVVRARFLSFGMILGIAFLLMVSLVIDAALSAFRAHFSAGASAWATLATIANVAIGFGLTSLVFALIYKVMPRAQIVWRDVWVGAVVTAALFTLGKFLIGLYIGKSGVSSAFGAAGSLVVVLLWVYYSAQILLIGAEFTWVYARMYGSRRHRKPTKADK